MKNNRFRYAHGLGLEVRGQVSINGMVWVATQPIAGVPIVGLSAMQKSVNQATLWAFKIFNKIMCGVVMIIEEESSSENQHGLARSGAKFGEEEFDGVLERGLWSDAESGAAV